ncbi:MAG: hypothetical protein AAGN66_07165 [Acidobacteriota bacterium]
MHSTIQRLEVVHYPRGPGNYTTESFDLPSWEVVFVQLNAMHPYETPFLTLMKYANIPDGDLMVVNGGNDVFHIQVVDSDANWFQALDPNGPHETISVWTSDQGFSCERKLTWPLETASRIVRHYFNAGERHPDFQWE